MKNLPYLILLTIFTFQFSLANAQKDQELGLHSEGGPWKFYPTKVKNDSLKNALLIGDSVMNGFHQSVIDSLKNIANVDYWLTPKHLNSEHLFSDLRKVISSTEYDVIQFNIGLHGWPEGRIKDHEYVPLLEKYVQTLIENAKSAKLIWASTTPVTEQDKAELNKEINPTIIQRNEWAADVMKKYNIAINDLYGLVSAKLHLARLDRFHWNAGGYELMAIQSIEFITKELNKSSEISTLSDYNVLWNSPSINSLGSMPAGNGDIGINLWVEENGDLLFYLSKTDAWSENARLLKVGKVRLSISPNPFKAGMPFKQELILKDGSIHIEAGENEEYVTIDVWVDANHPAVELNVKSGMPISAKVTTEPWRTERRQITGNEIHSAYGLTGDGAPHVFVEKDSILEEIDDGIIWMHRNKRSVWKDNLKLQGLEEYAIQNNDPLLHRTFGGLIHSKELANTGTGNLETTNSLKQFSISVYALTSQTETQNDWTQQINQLAKNIELLSRDERFMDHKNWWNSFWNRSYIHLSTSDENEKEKVYNVARGYALQRYMNACSGRGNSPIKFNGSIFTVDTKNLDNRFGGFDADYRQWGGPYWWQNTRLPYWSMLEAGDFELMQPLFKMYRDVLEIRKSATKKYYHHDGAFYPETMRHWGTFAESNYGWDRSELPLGMTENRFIRYYWQSGLEISLMMLDYYSFTQDEKLLKETILPVVTEVITFFDQHWGRDDKGKILFDPAMALETYRKAVNPTPEIVGINRVCAELLKLPETAISKSQREQYERLITELPEIPMREVDGEQLLAPAHEYSGKQNVENPELYAIFPYRRFGVGKENIEIARRSFAKREARENRGWQQHSIKAAYLGLTEEAANLMAQNFNASTTFYRFPTMWGPNYDWTPDQCHGSVAMTALQRMLVQYEGNEIYLFPAWPKSWDVEFKLHAPHNTTVKGTLKNGEITKLKVTPEEREKDIINTYKNADLPDAMTFLDGRKVETQADWDKRKKEIKQLWCEYYIGHYPKNAPELLSAQVTKTRKQKDGSTRKRIMLTFDTPNKKRFEIEVWEPKDGQQVAKPLFLTQPRDYQIQWAEEAVSRGYIACLYPGLDTHHNEQEYPGYQSIWKIFKDEYPDAGWESSLGIQAWLASRTLDYFLDNEHGYNIDTAAIGIAGHSRYGKQSIYAAAFDERFTSVITRSSGTPTACSYRFASRQTFMESVSDDDCPKAWVVDDLSNFYGRENELPIEGNSLMAAIAPRNLMIHTAYNDGSDPTFGVERNYLNAKKAYKFLNAEDNIYLSYRTGQHNPITETHTKHMFNYFDMTFGRGTGTREDFPEVLLHHFDFKSWKSKQRKQDLKLAENTTIEDKINWMLGEEPAKLNNGDEYHIKTEEELGVPAWSRDRWNPGNLQRVPFAFSGNMNGNIYFDPNKQVYRGTVIWLHPWNYSHGSNEGYGVEGTTIYWRLAQEGYIVVAYDQFGFGDQLSSAFGFYETNPHWSLLGRAVSDVSNVIDYLVDGKGIAQGDVPETDSTKIYICGFSYGGMVGLYAAALDKRIAAVASFSGFTPMRTDTDQKPTGGIRRLWEWHHVLPKLGLYQKKETKIPYDYDDLIQMIAPRNVLVYAPLRDRFSDADDINNCIKKAQKAWTDKSNLEFKSPDDICRFQKDQQDVVIKWLDKIGK